MKVNFPTTVTTDASKLEFLYALQEALRLEHNSKGKEVVDGKSTQAEWLNWKETTYIPKRDAIVTELNKSKDALKASKTFSIDLNKDFGNG